MNARRGAGQALVEFSIAIVLFLVLVMGVLDFGIAIYKYNGVSEAAREIARVASVYQGPVTFGSSPQITAVVATQRNLIPGLGTPTFSCRKVDGSIQALVANRCPSKDGFVNVTVTALYGTATPLLGLLGTFTMTGSSSAQIQQ